ncbi:AlpA family transcriptional regulator [Melghiribacillus thermohalophilus]|uniref:AlpA family transcriptional regulator n=1 Tax=Melghiribacillus thermohalophilus TaxID=1324956 RepID=A0A4R3N8H0_9BACI|nr:helix-turn-helix domain-containing protein [Melghiribacillus thermohalophilus]TCT23403.1 AlpA family transcriptional regulator [Melghiribacillus thermohalophilus]
MKFQLNSREEVEEFVRNEVLTTSEAIKILGISRQAMSNKIRDGKIKPVKKLRGDSLFLRSDIEEKKRELEVLRKKYRPYD